MNRIIKVVLLTLFFGILANRLYFLYYGIANVVTMLVVYTFIFLGFSLILKKVLKNSSKSRNLNLLLWSIFIGIIVLELGLRYVVGQNVQSTEKAMFGNYYSPYRNILLDSKLRYKDGSTDVGIRLNTPNSTRLESQPEFKFEHHYNQFGLRDIGFDQNQIDTSFVILGLGDSFMEGVGVSQDSSCMTLLSNKLKDSIPNVLTVNAGFRGSDPIFEFYKLREFLIPVYQPDLVVIAINETDINDIMIRGGLERFVSKSKVKYHAPPWWEYWYAFSFIQRQYIHRVLHKNWYFKTELDFRNTQVEVLQGLCNFIHIYYKSLSEDNNFKLIVSYTPMQHEVELNWPTYNGCDSLLKEKGITTVNMLQEYLDSNSDLQSYYWEKDRHLTSKGVEKWAQELADEILKNQNLRLE